MDIGRAGVPKRRSSPPRAALAALAVMPALVPSLLAGTAGADEGRAVAARVAAAIADQGLAVVGMGDSVDAAWPLARAVYADAALRPASLDEAHARVLVGQTPLMAGGDATAADLRDLAESRAAIHGDDAASRRLLESLAHSLHVKGVVVVEPASSTGGGASARPTARLFVTSNGAFDAARYEADAPAPVTWGSGQAAVLWGGAVQSLHRSFVEAPVPSGPATAPVPPSSGRTTTGGPGLALHALPSATIPPADQGATKSFYRSPWFWAAAGAAVFAAGAVYFATRNDGSGNIQLQVQVPK
jgi:hypothetical protein